MQVTLPEENVVIHSTYGTISCLAMAAAPDRAPAAGAGRRGGPVAASTPALPVQLLDSMELRLRPLDAVETRDMYQGVARWRSSGGRTGMMLGLALPGGRPIGATMTERLDSFFIALFLPVYMALSGYRTDLAEFTRSEASEKWCTLELFVALCVSGKLVGCVAAGLFFTMPFRDAIVLALMLNIRGIVEVAAINNWGDTMKATAEHYPSGLFARAKRRSLEHAWLSADLSVFTCLYSEDHAALLIDLLEASGSSRDSPMST
ncbi:unnamed protein product [Miscanthus lutarioriparius]|uniref:Cation/H+ exchanger transmembrane domain-containing protein n=1 Tax=Miscanthus lutarioriparius TaxID=422564 RepID=A0A811SKT2_9POAL|nr:unnamed protein product [Miscanthus lutarioriparius]